MPNQAGIGCAAQTYGYRYDGRGRLAGFTTQEGESTYRHDDFGQLTAADQPGAQPDESYAYDATGNRTNGGYQTGRPNLLRSDGRRWFDYDANGNRTRSTDLVTGEVTSYAYDHDNRLVGVTVTSSGGVLLKEVAYEYDLFGRMILRVGPDAAGTQTIVERFAHAGDHVLLKFNLAGQVVERYLYGPQVDQLLAVSRIGQAIPVVWALADHLNTVRDLVDSTGTVRLHIVYDSFGRVLLKDVAANDPAAAGLASFNILYTGREYDAATGLYYYRARWYDPKVGRFISRDPRGLGDGPNPFAYVQNGPLSATDPSGEVAVNIAGAITGAIHSGVMSWWRGDSLGWIVASTALGALGGAINPIGAFASAATAVGLGAVGALLGDARRGAELGGLIGMIGGGFGDAARYTSLARNACQATSGLPSLMPYALPFAETVAASIGWGAGLALTKNPDSAFLGANLAVLGTGIAWNGSRFLRHLRKPCFAAGTPIRTAEGSKPIEEIQAGDYVLSRDENDPNGPVLLKLVEETFVRTGRIWLLKIDGRDIRTTGEHPFYARGKGWTALAELDTTDVLLSEDGRWLNIEALEDTGSYETVFNFRVADFHTYFIGGDGWSWSAWAHNECWTGAHVASPGSDLARRAVNYRRRYQALNPNLNVAVAEIEVRGVTAAGNAFVKIMHVARRNVGLSLHSEERILEIIAKLRNRGYRVAVKRWYTERAPCRGGSGVNNSNCNAKIQSDALVGGYEPPEVYYPVREALNKATELRSYFKKINLIE